MLVTVADQDIEVRIDYRGLIAALHLERHRPDAVGLVGLRFFFCILCRIDDLQLHFAPRGDLIFVQHIANPRDQWREQRVGLLAEVTTD